MTYEVNVNGYFDLINIKTQNIRPTIMISVASDKLLFKSRNYCDSLVNYSQRSST